jgi:hypothetical protein
LIEELMWLLLVLVIVRDGCEFLLIFHFLFGVPIIPLSVRVPVSLLLIERRMLLSPRRGRIMIILCLLDLPPLLSVPPFFLLFQTPVIGLLVEEELLLGEHTWVGLVVLCLGERWLCW